MRGKDTDERTLEIVVVVNEDNLTIKVVTAWKLSPKDIRTMRKAMELTGRELAEKMDATPETVSRWENGGLAMGGYTEKVFRHAVRSVLGGRAPAILWNPLDIVGMKIAAARDGDAQLPPLAFEQVKVVIPQDGTKAPAWDRVSLEAA